MNVPVPDTLEQALDPGWLTAALGQRFPGVDVTGVERTGETSRITSNVRFHIDGTIPDGLAPDLCVKGYFNEAGLQARTAGLPEALFYRDVADKTGMRTLRCVYAGVDLAATNAVILTEDVISQGGHFLDGTSEYSVEQTAQSLTELAQLHGSTWGAVPNDEWIASRLGVTLESRGAPLIKENFAKPHSADVPDAVRDADRLVAVYRQVAARARAVQPGCVIHGDTHVGNVFIAGDGNPSWLDWQVVQKGPWFVDVGYHIASALTVDKRRAHEDELLRHYLSELSARGGEPPSFDEARTLIRSGEVHGFYFWAITIYVAPPIIASLLHRLGTAIEDHDSYAVAAA
ncbi:MAG TPA: phosphotransferase [Mycobacteriales bacterium]|nr:phosphotransferase [Mycobacteriales bacterium]